MEHTLVAFLVVNVALTAGAAGSILYASGVPYPYISPYALTYSYTRPPVVLSHPISLNFEAALAGAGLQSPVIVGASLEDIAADRRESEEIPGNQSPPEPSTALEEAAPSNAAESTLPETELPSPVPGPTALGETPAPPLASDELKYYHLSLPVTYTIPTPLAWPSASSQFHHQDGLGQYNYGYANEHSSKQEFKLLDGITRGAYNYIDAEGKLQTVSYVSDDEGFRVAATNLPQPAVPVEIPDSPEVAAAKAAHLQAQSEAVANVNRANAADAAAAAAAGAAGGAAIGGASESGDNVVSGCNETSGDSSPNEM